MIEWYLQHGLRITAVHQLIEYEPGMPFSWFPEEVANTRREADKDPLKKQLGDFAKLKWNVSTENDRRFFVATRTRNLHVKKWLLSRILGLRFLTI